MNVNDVTAIEVISEFMSPFEDDLTVLILGDQVDDRQGEEITAAFNNMRQGFSELPHIKKNKLPALESLRVPTADLFRGRIEDLVQEKACVVYLDMDLSRDVISLLTNNTGDVDELDTMLIDKYVIGMGQEKFIFDLTKTSDEQLNSLLAGMDARAGEFNYIIVENLMGVWIYTADEFTMIQLD